MSFFNNGSGNANEALDRANEKTIVFALPRELEEVTRIAHVQIPFNGRVIEVDAICEEAGLEDTLLSLEKTDDMVNWIPLSNKNILIKKNENYNTTLEETEYHSISEGEIMRVRVVQAGRLNNLTINVKININ